MAGPKFTRNTVDISQKSLDHVELKEFTPGYFDLIIATGNHTSILVLSKNQVVQLKEKLNSLREFVFVET